MHTIKTIPRNPSLRGLAEVIPDICYSPATGMTLTLLRPWHSEENAAVDAPHPLIVFVQGSAWTHPDIHYELAQLARYAQAGYVVATVVHRNSLEGNPFPNFLIDVKCAIRFLRTNADGYGIDPARVAIFGTSSGGNAALLTGLTGDDADYQSAEYAGVSDRVDAVVDCFGPTDMQEILAFVRASQEEGLQRIMHALLGTTNAASPAAEKTARQMSPYFIAEAGHDYPPFLILHGTADQTVPYAQSEKMFARLQAIGAQAAMIAVADAPHEGSFWSDAVHNEILAFFRAHL